MRLPAPLKRVFLVGFVLLVPLTIIEVYLRFTQAGSMAFWQPHPVYGKALIESGEAWYTNEGKAFVQINRHGFHDRNHEVEKPANTFRIAVLGDSFVEAVQLPYRQAFWYLLSEKLKHCSALSGKQIESLGFGVSNYGTGQQILLLENEVRQYQPDEVVLSFYQGNDITDNSPIYTAGSMPTFSIAGNTLVVDNKFSETPGFKLRMWLVRLGYYRLMLEFRVLELLRTSIKQISARLKAPPAMNLPAQPDAEHSKQQRLFEREQHSAWEFTQQLLRLLQMKVKSTGAGFTLLSIPDPQVLLPDGNMPDSAQARVKLDYAQQIDARLVEFARQEGFSLVDLGRELKAHVENSGDYIFGFQNNRLGYGHFSEAGHVQTAALLAKHVCAKQGGDLP